MTNERKTDWQVVRNAGKSTCNEPCKTQINQSLIDILNRFEKPIREYFAGRLRSFAGIDEEELYAEFQTYLISERKKIFRNADPGIGKLQSYIYSIAWSFANKYIQKQCRLPIITKENDIVDGNLPEMPLTRKEQKEYVKLITNLALSKLKERSRSKYDLLKYKYFGSFKPSACDLAMFLNLMPKNAGDTEIKKIGNTVNQRLRRARQMFLQLVECEIRTGAEVLIEEEFRQQMVEEKLTLCRRMMEKDFIEQEAQEIDKMEIEIILAKEKQLSPALWQKMLEHLQERICRYFSFCLEQEQERTSFDDFCRFFFKISPLPIENYRKAEYYLFALACRFIQERFSRHPDYYRDLLLRQLALEYWQEKDPAIYDLLAQKYHSREKISADQLAVKLHLISVEELQEKDKKTKARNIVYQRLKRAKAQYQQEMKRISEIILPMITDKL